MKPIATCLAGIVALLVLAAVPEVARGNDYQLDDGTAEDSIGINNGGDLIALNQFFVTPGKDMIMSVSIAWGSPNFPDPSLNSLAYTAAIWSDPNDDGNPSDAVLLGTAPGVISNAGTNTFNVSIFSTCIQIPTNSFFVGFIITQGAGQFPAAFDETSPLSNRSFITGSSNPGMGDIVNLTGPNNNLPLNAVENYGFAGNWLIRADACAAVPEPASTTLGLLGGIAVFIGCRRKVRMPAFKN